MIKSFGVDLMFFQNRQEMVSATVPPIIFTIHVKGLCLS